MTYSPSERRILTFTAVAHFAVHFFEHMFPTAAIAIAREAGLPVNEVLGWSFLGYLLFGLGALPAGLIADRWQARRMLQICLIGTAAGSLLVSGSSPGLGLALSLGILGLFSSIYHPTGMSLIASGVRSRGRALGLNGIAGNVGIASAPWLTVATIGVAGWRGAYALFGALLLIVGLVSLAARLEEPRRIAAEPRSVPGASGNATLLFVILCVCMMLAGFTYRGSTLTSPAYLAERFSPVYFGAALSAVYLVGTISQYWGGALADRGDLRRLYLAFHLASLPALVAMSFTSGWPLVLSAAVFVFFSLGMQPIENSLVAHLAPEAWRSTGYGVKFILTFGVGSLAAPAVGLVKGTGDLSSVFVMLGGVVALLVAFAFLLTALGGRQVIRNVPPVLALEV